MVMALSTRPVVSRVLTTVSILAFLGALFVPAHKEPPRTLRVLAGSELQDLLSNKSLMNRLRNELNITLQPEYIGTLEGAEQLANGIRRYDLAWFSSDKYLSLLKSSRGEPPLASTPIMQSPVIVGIRHAKAQELGWTQGNPVSWANIADKARSGALRFAMTNPASSNSGFSTLVGVAGAFDRNGPPLQTEDVDRNRLKDLFYGQVLTAASSGWLTQTYAREQGQVDGIINYESELIAFQRSDALNDRLDLIYPTDGMVMAGYPLLRVNQAASADYTKLVDWLRSRSVQEDIMRATARRPIDPKVTLDSRFSIESPRRIPLPNDLGVIDRLLFAYLDEFRRPTRTIYVLDVSASMGGADSSRGRRIDNLKHAFSDLTGGDASIAGQFSRFRKREKITIIPFNDKVIDNKNFAVKDPNSDSADLTSLRNYVNQLPTSGQTAIYDALSRAYQDLRQEADEGSYRSIVLMTDGEQNAGLKAEQFLQSFRQYDPGIRDVKTFAIRFGEANYGELRQVAETTGGRVFDANVTSLSAAFKEIRGYQ